MPSQLTPWPNAGSVKPIATMMLDMIVSFVSSIDANRAPLPTATDRQKATIDYLK
jgi:hypothetical protein